MMINYLGINEPNYFYGERERERERCLSSIVNFMDFRVTSEA